MLVVENKDVSYLDNIFRDESGRLTPFYSHSLDKIPQRDIALWCHKNAVYGLPVLELVCWLKDRIGDRSAIEIGAGVGCLGRALGIPMTDSLLQNRPEIKSYYALTRQPTIEYGLDVKPFDALSAIHAFKPDVVIASWVTHKYNPEAHHLGGNQWGIDEHEILKQVKTYILIGHENVHGNKPIMKEPHKEFDYEWLHSRSMTKDLNRIYLWEN